MHTALKTYREQNSITKYATHIRQTKISAKHLIKLRKRYRNFELTEFDEWHFDYPLITHLNWFQQDLIIIINIITGRSRDLLYLDALTALTTNGLNRSIKYLIE